MSFDALINFALWMGILLFALSYLRQRSRAKSHPGRPPRFGFYPTGASLGNALQQLQLFVQPRA
jgi:hypothetical protein